MNDRIRTDIAHNARVWNYWLGGKDNYEVDRAVGDQVAGMLPEHRRHRPRRPGVPRPAVTLPGRGARASASSWTSAPACRPPTTPTRSPSASRPTPGSSTSTTTRSSCAHARALLTSTPEGVTDYIDADVARPGDDPASAPARTLDLTRPVAVMMLGILNFVLDTDEARSIVRTADGRRCPPAATWS